MKIAAPLILVSLVFLGSIASNRVTPLIFGYPPFFAWHVFSVFLLSGGMWLIFRTDPQNRAKRTEPDEDKHH
ncbi:DUF3311 domain-containing protein [Rhizobium sp. S163]|uniref:DUF3311 domain-containing protein n=1 Tax=Rhizobium sp. S163 TaxID=3055039 RepID=UPI0025A93D3F|nr:DUF3311 domain-containing protein [Rhizobium sp. S163]MDM9648358.1 DUF3311 domain-containing protein [Rhizobium sp. S163]